MLILFSINFISPRSSVALSTGLPMESAIVTKLADIICTMIDEIVPYRYYNMIEDILVL